MGEGPGVTDGVRVGTRVAVGRVEVGPGVSLGVTGTGVSVGVPVIVGVQVGGNTGGPTVAVGVTRATAPKGVGAAKGPAKLGTKNNVV